MIECFWCHKELLTEAEATFGVCKDCDLLQHPNSPLREQT